MRPQQIMFMGLLFTTGILLSLALGGSWLGDEDVSIANSLTVFKDVSFFGLFSFPVPNIGFFLIGLKALTMLDFAFFTGGFAIVQWVMFFVFVAGVIFGLFTIAIYVASGKLGR
jgi:hypothetical protein